MKITELKVQGFRSLKDITWRPGDLNVIVGPNASGKTNLINVLRMLKAIGEGELQDFVQKQGGADAIRWDGIAKHVLIDIVLSGEPDTFELDNALYHASLMPERYGFYFRYERLDTDFGSNKTAAIRDGMTYRVTELPNDAIDRKSSDIYESMLSLGDTTFAIASFRASLLNMTEYSDIRTDAASPTRRPPIVRHDLFLSEDAENLATVLHTLYTTDQSFREDIDDAMNAAFGADYNGLVFPPVADQHIQMWLNWRSLRRPQTVLDMSDGTLRFLAIMTILLSPNRPEVITIEEPETGLHPRMFGVIAEVAKQASNNSQIIFTTHSTEFLNALGRFEPTTTVIGREDGATTVDVVDKNTLDNWLKDYQLGDLHESGTLEAIV